MNEEPRKNNLFISDGIFLAIFSAVIYWISISYEVAFLGVFGVPSDFAEVQPNTILVTLFSLSSVCYLFFSIANMLALSWPRHPALQEKVLRIGFLLLFPLWNLVNYGFRRQDMALYVACLVILLIFELLWPLLVYSRKGRLIDRFVEDEIREAPARERTLFGRVSVLTGPLIYIVLLAGFFGGGLAKTAAQARAEKQTEYPIVVDQPTLAIIRSYSDRLIGVTFDEKTRRLDGKFVLMPKDSKSNLELTWGKVGPLLKRESKV